MFKETIAKFKEAFRVYVINSWLPLDMYRFEVESNIQELFIQSENLDMSCLWISFYVKSSAQNISVVIITIEVHNPTSKQLSMILQLKPSVRRLYF